MAAAYAGLNCSGLVTGTNTTLTLPTVRTIAAGEHIFVATSNNGGSVMSSTVTVGGVSLAFDKIGAETFTHVELWSGRTASPITSGASMIVTLPSSVSVSICAICFSATGIVTSSWVDKTANNAGTSVTPSSGTTAATVFADEFAVGVSKPFGSPAGAVANSPYSLVAEVNDTGATATLHASYAVLAGTGTQVSTWTLAASQSYDALIATYQAVTAAQWLPINVHANRQVY